MGARTLHKKYGRNCRLYVWGNPLRPVWNDLCVVVKLGCGFLVICGFVIIIFKSLIVLKPSIRKGVGTGKTE